MIFELAISVIGLISGFLVMSQFPLLPGSGRQSRTHKRSADTGQISAAIMTDPVPGVKLTVIIPVLKCEDHLPMLLKSLSSQSHSVDEIIVVYDEISDQSITAARALDALVFPIPPKPTGLSYLNWAFLTGAKYASGDLYLFLENVVDLSDHLISDMLHAAVANPPRNPTIGSSNKAISTAKEGLDHPLGEQTIPTVELTSFASTIVVHPYHGIWRLYENISLFICLIMAARSYIAPSFISNGTNLNSPVVLMPRSVFQTFFSQTSNIMPDFGELDLASLLYRQRIPTRAFWGGRSVEYRTREDSYWLFLHDLVTQTTQWVKGTAPGLLALIILWLIACTSIVIGLIQASLQTDAWPVLIYLALYLLTLVQLNLASRHVGRFSKSAIFFYPLWLAAFWVIFIISIFRNYVFSKSKSNQEETTL